MKIAVIFLLVVVSCYFDLTSAHCMSKCSKSCWQPHLNDVRCLKRALALNPLQTVNAMANLLCSYDRCKAIKNKNELIRGVRNLQEITKCPLENILGNDFTLEELHADVDYVLQYLLRTIVDLLNRLDLGSLSTPLCGPLRPLVTKVNNILYILGMPSLDGRIQINGVKHFLGTVAKKSPVLLTHLLEVLMGPLANIGDLTGLIGKTVGGLTGLITDVTGGLGRTIEGLTSKIGGVTGILGRTTGGLGKPIAGLTSGLEGVIGSLGGTTGGLGHTVDELTSGFGSVTRVLDGATEVGGLISGLGGATDVLTNLRGSDSTTGLGGIAVAGGTRKSAGAGEQTNTLGKATNSLGGVTGSYNLVPETTKGFLDGTTDLNKSTLVNDNILSNSGIAPDVNDLELSGGVSGRLLINPDNRQGSSVLTIQESADTSGNPLQGGLLKSVGNIVGGILGGSPTQKSSSLLWK